MSKTIGNIHSFQSLGAVDGPGIRFVVFMQGCNLRCGCCHNPDTWDINSGTPYTPEQVVEKVKRYKEYFGTTGGITVSGGEPLLWADFVREVFTLCHKNGINTCLDTSGSILNTEVKELLKVTDRVLLDIKYTDDEQYKKHVGCSLDAVLEFLDYLDSENIPTVIRQVTIPTLNDTEKNILKLKEIASEHGNIEKLELLPFRKICEVKYENLNLQFPFAHIPEPSLEQMEHLTKLLRE